MFMWCRCVLVLCTVELLQPQFSDHSSVLYYIFPNCETVGCSATNVGLNAARLFVLRDRGGQVAGGDDAEAAVETVTLSDELKSLASESLIQPGHDLTQLGTNAAGKELVVTGGEGAYLVTADGTKVLDGPGGIWNVQMGYGQMKIVDAVSEQMTTLPFNSPFATIAAPAATLAKEIAKKAPADLNHVFFVTGGSEANDTALQFIYYRNNYMGRPNKKIVLARERAYHGTTYMAHSLSMDTDNMESMNSMGGKSPAHSTDNLFHVSIGRC